MSNAPQMRLETLGEHIARDMREGRFPAMSEPQMVPVEPQPKTYTEAEVKALIAAAVEGAAEKCGKPNGPWQASAFYCREAIRASIPDDHKAALDAYVAGKMREAENKRFRALLRHEGATPASAPWYEEFWAVRADDLRALVEEEAKT